MVQLKSQFNFPHPHLAHCTYHKIANDREQRGDKEENGDDDLLGESVRWLGDLGQLRRVKCRVEERILERQKLRERRQVEADAAQRARVVSHLHTHTMVLLLDIR
jgi:hypothetical protein